MTIRKNTLGKRTLAASAATAAFALAAFVAVGAAPAPARAAEGFAFKLPSTVTLTAYGTTAAGYRQAVSVGKALKSVYGVTLRILPAENDVSRTAPLRAGRAHMTATGAGLFQIQEGVYDFGQQSWGPQPVRIVAMSVGDSNLTLGVAGDIGVKTMADLRGKRVMWVKGGPALNHNIAAMLAFGGLTWDDVERVDFSGYAAGWRGVLNNQVDAGFAITTSGIPRQVHSSPRGLVWPPLPHSDTAGWARVTKVAPYFAPHEGTLGAGLSKANPHQGGVYPYPILAVYAQQDGDLVYSMTRSVIDLYDQYADAKVGSNGFALDRQIFKWAIPFHNASIAHYKEIGAWTADMQAHNDRLVRRQSLLATTWQDYRRDFGWKKGDDYYRGWMGARAKALTSQDFATVYNYTPSE